MSTQVLERPTVKRDALLAIEKAAQTGWNAQKVFESNAPASPSDDKNGKYFATFPYPYMNGKLHLGHAFSLSKPEFAIGYQRLKGKRTLFPFGFHVTGMPIKACADKLVREIEMFGKLFERYEQVDVSEQDIVVDIKELVINSDPSKKKKHGKAASKNTGLTYQFEIMRSMDVPNEEIHKFADPKHWLYYFPPLATTDLKRLGAHIDWRRSFITTDVNPYYDSFIRWQFNQLRNQDVSKIQFGERYTIYSALDGQACMDHDRSSGEGVGVQEYTGVKLQVKFDELNSKPASERFIINGLPVGGKLLKPDFSNQLGNCKLYFVCATLRPETMYGQTNCFVGVDLDYGVYRVSDNEAWVCTERAAQNMAWQGLFQKKGVVDKLIDLKGIDLIGIPLIAPLCPYSTVYCLPMENVLATKGTGVVTSVPSDSPDDYITMMDLSKKAAYYNISEDWVKPFLPPRPIIRTPNFGDLAAVTAIERLKINSQKDKKQLSEAKEMVYKEGFYNGTIIVGEYSGKSVQEAKPLIRKYLIEQGLAFAYCEPEGLVMSRSGDECVVTLAHQWYIDYGEESWKAKAVKCLAQMNTYSDETRNAFSKTLDWLNQWACSRSFGLGSRLPWDPEWLIESLSDSTIYMAYYTVAHMLHGGSVDGSVMGSAQIPAKDMTDDVWSYIMLSGPLPKDTSISESALSALRREFEYFYPMDLRCSGKDLINNHLTFCIYNHTAVFPERHWPLSIRANGHLLLNSMKMSKSTGNFMTLAASLEKYGADATRFALADAGDGLEDANFLEKTADDAILKLYTELEFIVENMKSLGSFRSGPFTWNDQVFNAEMDATINQAEVSYDAMLYREALKNSYYDLQASRNEYRKATIGQGVSSTNSIEKFEGMHRDLFLRYVEMEALLLAPITPHWSENVWMQILKKPESIMHARWPKVEPGVSKLVIASTYVRTLTSKIRSAEEAAAKKKKSQQTDETMRTLRIFVATSFPDWQEESMIVLQASYDSSTNSFVNDREMLIAKGLAKNKSVMPFIAKMKKEFEIHGSAAFERKLSFDEMNTLEINLEYMRRELTHQRIGKIELVDKSEVNVADMDDKKKAEMALPGHPTYRIV